MALTRRAVDLCHPTREVTPVRLQHSVVIAGSARYVLSVEQDRLPLAPPNSASRCRGVPRPSAIPVPGRALRTGCVARRDRDALCDSSRMRQESRDYLLKIFCRVVVTYIFKPYPIRRISHHRVYAPRLHLRQDFEAVPAIQLHISGLPVGFTHGWPPRTEKARARELSRTGPTGAKARSAGRRSEPVIREHLRGCVVTGARSQRVSMRKPRLRPDLSPLRLYRILWSRQGEMQDVVVFLPAICSIVHALGHQFASQSSIWSS